MSAARPLQSLLFSRVGTTPTPSAFPHRRGAPALGSFVWPSLVPLKQVCVCPVLRAPELDTGLQVGSHQNEAEGQNPLPHPADHAACDAAQDMVGLLGCERTLPAHVELLVNQHPQVLLLRAALNPLILQSVLMLQTALTQGQCTQDLALGPVGLHVVHLLLSSFAARFSWAPAAGVQEVLQCFTQALWSEDVLNGSRTPTLTKSAFA